MCYLNGTTDRDYTLRNRQAVHKYGKITLLTDDGITITEDFEDTPQQMDLERKFRNRQKEEFDGRAIIFLTFRSRMDTIKASKFLDEVAERVGFRFRKKRINELASEECS